jgi:hypothetical protein
MNMRKSRETDVIALHFASKLKKMLCTEFSSFQVVFLIKSLNINA